MIFLLLQITRSSPDLGGETIGVTNPLTDYVKFLPVEFTLPTFFSAAERELLIGTSLEDAVDQKLRSLDNEFELLCHATRHIPWCRKHWWDDETGHLTIDDWKLVDAIYRSRAFDLPGSGHCVVPCIDMANHASREKTVALYEADERGNAVLQLREGISLTQEEEVTITYGDEKGASEMIFSYGFLEDDMVTAQQIFLDLDIPGDDPFRTIKRSLCREAPGVRIFYDKDGEIQWESAFTWWGCVNQEDGLEFEVLRSTDGERDVRMLWKGNACSEDDLLRNLLQDSSRDVFELRTIVMIQNRVERQVTQLERSDETFHMARQGVGVRDSVWSMIDRLRNLELDMLAQTYTILETKVSAIFTNAANSVQNLLRHSIRQ